MRRARTTPHLPRVAGAAVDEDTRRAFRAEHRRMLRAREAKRAEQAATSGLGGGGGRAKTTRKKRPRRSERDRLFRHYAAERDAYTASYLPADEVHFPKLEFPLATGASGPETQADLESLFLSGLLDLEVQQRDNAVVKGAMRFLKMPHAQPNLSRDRVDEMLRLREGQRVEAVRETLRAREVVKSKPKTGLSERDRVALGELQKRLRKAEREKFGFDRAKAVYGSHGAPAPAPPAVVEPPLHSEHMGKLFTSQRVQIVMACRIQHAWRFYRRRLGWHRFLTMCRAARKIQKRARGMMARRLVSVWLSRRSVLVVVMQAIARSWRARFHWKLEKQHEDDAATTIQSHVRGMWGRQRYTHIRQTTAATHIQAMWRGGVGRTRTDRLYLDRMVTRIQALVRGHLERKVTTLLRRELTHAAVAIQCCFRGANARARRNELLLLREIAQRQDLLNALRAEEEYLATRIAVLKRDFERKKFREEMKKWSRKQAATAEEVYQLEVSYLDLRGQRAQLSPRAIEQGWSTELDHNIADHRRRITAAKSRYLFDEGIHEVRLEREEVEWRHRIEDLEIEIESYQRWRQAELQNLSLLQLRQKFSNTDKLKRQAVADERRKWRITHFTKTGKPDKQRVAGRPWAETAYAGQERETFNIGNSDLFINNNLQEHKPGSEAAAKQLADQIQLQSSVNQVQQYSALLKPLFSTMDTHLCDLFLFDGYPKIQPPEEDIVAPDAQPKAEEDVVADLQAKLQGFDISAAVDGDVVEARPLSPPAQQAKKQKKQKKKKKRYRQAKTIPWNLLDELEAEKYKLKVERALKLAFNSDVPQLGSE